MEDKMVPVFKDLMTPQQTSRVLGVTPETLSVWRCTRRYPLPFVKIGRKVLYIREDINKFIESRTFCKNTEEN